jgi:hypothetical protein
MKTIRAVNNTSIQDMNGEIWKDIIDYEDIYRISNYGRVKSLRRLYEKTAWIAYRNEIIMKITIVRKNTIIALNKNGTTETFKIKELVAKHFLENPNNFKNVININGDFLNNRVENLEWIK